jgi:ubiquinone/menaquinone biosynthesis C-methylase UbiE
VPDKALFRSLFRCPRCGEKLAADRPACAGCGTKYEDRDGILDFIEADSLDEHNRVEMTLHDSLADKYEVRYSRKYAAEYSRYWNEQFTAQLGQGATVVLDCGCGTGDLARELALHSELVIGIDISFAMLAKGRDALRRLGRENVVWAASPGEHLPLAGESCDAVCYRGALHHIGDDRRALEEARRVLKPGGKLLLSEPNGDSLALLLPRLAAGYLSKRFANDHRSYTSAQLTQKLAAAGFDVSFMKYLSFLSEPLCGMSDILPLMRVLPGSDAIARALILFDEFCSKIPLVRRQSFELFIAAQKA